MRERTLVHGNVAAIAKDNLIVITIVARITHAARDVVRVGKRRQELRVGGGELHVRRQEELLVLVLHREISFSEWNRKHSDELGAERRARDAPP